MCLISSSVQVKKRADIEDLKCGLNSGFLQQLLEANASCVLVVFTLSDESVIKSSDILRLIKTEDDITHKQMEVVTWFNEYVHMLDDGTDIFSIIYYCGENQI